MALSPRTASLTRKTNETDISLRLNLDGRGRYDIQSGIGFFDHMLEQLSRHSLIDIDLKARGDLHIDDHHTVEDCGIALGDAVSQALAQRRGVNRYASLDLVMDEACTRASVDLSGRPYLVWQVEFNAPKIGRFDSELVREFFQAFTQHAKITLHVVNFYGVNNHHIAETCFKAVARVLRHAMQIDPLQQDTIPSTKGSL